MDVSDLSFWVVFYQPRSWTCPSLWVPSNCDSVAVNRCQPHHQKARSCCIALPHGCSGRPYSSRAAAGHCAGKAARCFGEPHRPQEPGSAGSAHVQSCPSCAGWGRSLSVIYFVLLLEAIAGQQSAARQNGAARRWLGENGFDSLNAAKWVGNK